MHPCPSWNFPSVCSWGSVIFFPLLILLRLLLSLQLELPDLSFSYRHGCLKSSLYPSFVLVFWQYLLCHTHSFISEMYRETSNTSVSLWSISWEIVAMAIDTWILQKTVEFCQENALVIANTLFQQHKRRLYTWTSPDGCDVSVQLLSLLLPLHSQASLGKSLHF